MQESNTPILAKTTSFKLPSGNKITIRETDGNDDEVISKMKDVSDGSIILNYLSGIILQSSEKQGRLSPEDIREWKVRDKYFTLVKSRIFSLGADISFKIKCRECKKENNYDEDLNKYDIDFDKALADDGIPYKFAPTAYNDGTTKLVEFQTAKGTKIRYKHLDGHSEKFLINFAPGEMNKNTDLLAREIEWLEGSKWTRIKNFKFLSSKEMVEIRNNIRINDLPFDCISECDCPNCGTQTKISLIATADFFFPGEIS